VWGCWSPRAGSQHQPATHAVQLLDGTVAEPRGNSIDKLLGDSNFANCLSVIVQGARNLAAALLAAADELDGWSAP